VGANFLEFNGVCAFSGDFVSLEDLLAESRGGVFVSVCVCTVLFLKKKKGVHFPKQRPFEMGSIYFISSIFVGTPTSCELRRNKLVTFEVKFGSVLVFILISTTR